MSLRSAAAATRVIQRALRDAASQCPIAQKISTVPSMQATQSNPDFSLGYERSWSRYPHVVWIKSAPSFAASLPQ
jgi:hypothetical protein